jgi:peptidyl-dipeptidase A
VQSEDRPVKPRHALLAAAVAGALVLTACKRDAEPAPAPAVSKPAAQSGETADQFVARVNAEVRKLSTELNSAQWLSATYINGDSELVAAKANERWLGQLNTWIEQSKRYDGQALKPETARALKLLRLWTSMPAPKDPQKLEELTQLATRMEGMYGAGSYCTGEGSARQCRDIGQLSDVLAKSRDYDAQLDAWQGWHTISIPMRKDYVRFAELVNEGAKELGFADAGELWRSGYDMTPAELASESDRLWGQVKPLYEQLRCYARGKLDAQYGKDKGEVAGGLLPAHLMGNLWQQDWSNLWDILQPYKDAGSLDVNGALKRMADADLARELGKPVASDASAAERGFLAQRAAQLATAKAIT